MNRLCAVLVLVLALVSGRAFALGIDIGPVHVHGTKVKVGNTIELKVEVDKVTKDEDEKDRVRKLTGHRKGDSDDKFEIKVIWKELDDDSKELLKEVKTEKIYKMKLEKMDDDWKLLKIRKNDDD
jgi:hypothetical protein